jgi:hypothetical protein
VAPIAGHAAINAVNLRLSTRSIVTRDRVDLDRRRRAAAAATCTVARAADTGPVKWRA